MDICIKNRQYIIINNISPDLNCDSFYHTVHNSTITQYIKLKNIFKKEILFYVLSVALLQSRVALDPHKIRLWCIYGGHNKFLSVAVVLRGHGILWKYLQMSCLHSLAHSFAAFCWLLRWLWQFITNCLMCNVFFVIIISEVVYVRRSWSKLKTILHGEATICNILIHHIEIWG